MKLSVHRMKVCVVRLFHQEGRRPLDISHLYICLLFTDLPLHHLQPTPLRDYYLLQTRKVRVTYSFLFGSNFVIYLQYIMHKYLPIVPHQKQF